MITCPKCGSEDCSSQKKGFSGTKAIAGAVIAGPAGVLAGTHGSNRINVHCLKCGHSWDPKKEFQKNKDKQNQQAFQDREKWKKKVIDLYDRGKLEEAESTYLSRLRYNEKLTDIHLAVGSLKK